MTPTPSRRAVPGRALKGQQGPGAHLPPYFEANPLHIVLDGTLPGLSGKHPLCPVPVRLPEDISTDAVDHSEQVMNEGIATGCQAQSSELVPKASMDTKFTFQLLRELCSMPLGCDKVG